MKEAREMFDTDGHLGQTIGLYVLGGLSDEECAAADRHLGSCHACRRELADFHDAMFSLALLDDDEARNLLAEPGELPADPGAKDRVASQRDKQLVTDPREKDLVAGPDGKEPVAAPADGRRSRAPRRHSRFWVHARTALRAGAFALLVGFVGGWLASSLADAPPARVVAAGNDQTTGAAMTVSVTDEAGKARVVATVNGLRAGEPYRAFVVTTDGSAYQAGEISTVDGTTTVRLTLAVPIQQLAYFTVVHGDGSVVMVAWFSP